VLQLQVLKKGIDRDNEPALSMKGNRMIFFIDKT
jgi:hypothetical protein